NWRRPRSGFQVAVARKREWRQTKREKRWSVSWNATSRLRNFVPASYAHLGNQSPARNLYWASVRGTTERRPILTSGESAKSLLDFIWARETRSEEHTS